MLPQIPADRYIKVGNLKIRYLADGNEGTAVILLHGLGVSADIWMYNIHALAKEHRVYAPDLVGFGRSEKPGPSFSLSDYTAFLDEFVNTLKMGKVNLVGQSLGGGIALHYGIHFPEKVNKLVLVDNAGFGREVTWKLRMLSLPLLGELFSHPTRRGVEIVFKLAVRNRTLITDEFVELYYDFFSQPGFQKFFLRILRQAVTIRGIRKEILNPITENLYKLTRPVLIIWGEKDRVLSFKQGYFGKENLPNAKLEIIEGCGHIPFFDRSDEFNRMVLSFLSDNQKG